MDYALIDRATFNDARAQLGTSFGRIVGYFREDGVAAIQAIDAAVRERDATALVRPAHKLKGEALQLGAEQLGTIAEAIEKSARRAVEQHSFPRDITGELASLHPVFAETMAFFDREAMPVNAAPSRVMGFGRKVAAR